MFAPSLHYQHPGLGDDHYEDPYAKAKMATCKWVAEKLNRHYPGHAWHVEVTMCKTGGLIKIRINALMPPNRWYCLQVSAVASDAGGRLIMRAGGELLERYKIPRTGFMLDHWKQALDAMPLQSRLKSRGHLAPLL